MTSAVALSKCGKCDNRITDEYCISNGTGWERIVTGNKKGNILSNRTERQIGQRTSPIGGATRQIERNRKGEYIL